MSPTTVTPTDRSLDPAAAETGSVEVTSALAEAEWAAFVREASGGNIFLTPELSEVMSSTPGHRPQAWALRRDGAIVALTQVVSVVSGPALAGRAPGRAIGYGGVATAPGESDGSAVGSLMDAYRPPRGTLFTELRHVAGAPDQRAALEAVGYRWQPHLNFVVDLSAGSEAVFAGFGARTRKHLRWALRRGAVRVVEVTTDRQMSAWYGLLESTYRRARVPLADRILFDAARSVLGPRGMIHLTLAMVGDSPAACSAELYYGGRVSAWYGGVDRSFAAELPNHVLTWEVMRRAADAGQRIYDWGGAGEPDRPYGVRDFKAHFGGQLVNPGRSVRVHHRLGLAAAEFAYRRLYRRGRG